MLESQTVLPPLHKYIQLKNTGCVSQQMMLNSHCVRREPTSAIHKSSTIGAPISATPRRSHRFSQGWGSQTPQIQ